MDTPCSSGFCGGTTVGIGLAFALGLADGSPPLTAGATELDDLVSRLAHQVDMMWSHAKWRDRTSGME